MRMSQSTTKILPSRERITFSSHLPLRTHLTAAGFRDIVVHQGERNFWLAVMETR